MMIQEFKAQGRKDQILPNLGSVAGSQGPRTYKFSCMRAQFLLGPLHHEIHLKRPNFNEIPTL